VLGDRSFPHTCELEISKLGYAKYTESFTKICSGSGDCKRASVAVVLKPVGVGAPMAAGAATTATATTTSTPTATASATTTATTTATTVRPEPTAPQFNSL
jgi:hypothetical protein